MTEPTRPAANVEAEPVAWMYESKQTTNRYVTIDRSILHPEDTGWTETPLYPASALEAARREALEEAAKACENLCFFTDIDELRDMTKQEMSVRTCHEAAAAIRALKENTNG